METGYIYILTNPSFPDYVKIGYADNVEKRLESLNRSECTPFAFRVYAYYKVNHRLTDLKIHNIIDKLNPNLRSIDNVNGKQRVREFYAMSKEDAFEILQAIAEINGLEENLVLVKPTENEKKEEQTSIEIAELNINRHHFKSIKFSSSLTGKKYLGKTGEDGTLCIVDLETNEEIPNNSKFSKKAIVRKAIEDIGEETEPEETLYQLYHRLTKLVLNK